MEAVKKFVNKVLAYVISGLLILMTLLVLWQVFTRYILNHPSVFTEELVIVILVWTSFIGAAYAFGTREHMALVFLRNGLSGRWKTFLNIFIDILIVLFVFFILLVGGKNISLAVLDNKTPILGLSKSVMYSSMFVSGIIILLFQVINIIEDIQETTNTKEVSNGN